MRKVHRKQKDESKGTVLLEISGEWGEGGDEGGREGGLLGASRAGRTGRVWESRANKVQTQLQSGGVMENMPFFL